MERLVEVEEVFGENTLDESPFAIVHAEGDEGESCLPPAGQDAAAYNGLWDTVVAEDVED